MATPLRHWAFRVLEYLSYASQPEPSEHGIRGLYYAHQGSEAVCTSQTDASGHYTGPCHAWYGLIALIASS